VSPNGGTTPALVNSSYDVQFDLTRSYNYYELQYLLTQAITGGDTSQILFSQAEVSLGMANVARFFVMGVSGDGSETLANTSFGLLQPGRYGFSVKAFVGAFPFGAPEIDTSYFVRLALSPADSVTPTPEPASFLLVGIGAIGFAGRWRRSIRFRPIAKT
jgi:hypothetical protein